MAEWRNLHARVSARHEEQGDVSAPNRHCGSADDVRQDDTPPGYGEVEKAFASAVCINIRDSGASICGSGARHGRTSMPCVDAADDSGKDPWWAFMTH